VLCKGLISYPAGSRVLEAGCGVGAQTCHPCEEQPENRYSASYADQSKRWSAWRIEFTVKEDYETGNFAED
jgi:hypothetical protein